MRSEQSPLTPMDQGEAILRHGVRSLMMIRASREACRATAIRRAVDAGGYLVAEQTQWVLCAYERASEAIRAACEIVSASGHQIRACVVTGEYLGDWQTLRAHAEAALAYADAGQVIVCLGTQELARTALPTPYGFLDMGAMEVPGTLEKVRLFLVDHPSLQSQEAPKRLGPQRTSVFIGRQRELTQVRQALDFSRVVTLAGPCGIGKTALVRRLCQELEGEFSDGIWTVELSDLADERLVLPHICRALEIGKGQDERFASALLAWLSDKRGMLVLDGCERWTVLLADLIGRITAECPEVQILCCGQRRTKAPGEIVIRLGGLEVAPEGLDWELALDCDSVTLFVERAQQADRSFEPDKSNTGWIVRICRQLDGIPLAIELAAAKAVTLSPRQIFDRLDERFALLKDPKTPRPGRQSTLRHTLDWSVGLLSEPGKVLLRRLSVLLGAFSVDMAVAVCADDAFSSGTVASAFEELVECSILTPSKIGGDERYFYLNETFRLYGSEMLKRAGEQASIVERKLTWIAGFAMAMAEQIYGSEGTLWKARCAAAYEDMRDAIRLDLKRDDVEQAARIAIACHAFWYEHGYFAEGRQIFEKVLSHPNVGDLLEYPRYLNVLATLALADLDSRAATLFAVRSIRMARKARDLFVEACAENTLGMIATTAGDRRRAHRRYLRASRLFRAVNDDQRLYFCLGNVLSSCEGPMTEVEEAIYDEAAEVAKRLGSWYQESDLCNTRAERELASGRVEAAYRSIRRALALMLSQDSVIPMGNEARTMVKVLAAMGRASDACRWYGLAQTLRSEAKSTIAFNPNEVEKVIEELREKHGAANVGMWISEGRMMSRAEYGNLIKSTY